MLPSPAALEAIARRHALSAEYPPEAIAECARILEAPGIDDPELEDRRDLPFVTIDNEGSRDLDQALFIERVGAGYRLRYALADAAYYVRPESALFAEALRRGASYYLPDRAYPMLPPPLSEGIVSLNPEVERRAMLWTFELDAEGEIGSASLGRARVRSVAKLSYAGVQRYYDAPGESPLAGKSYTPSLELLRELGRLRLRIAAQNHVVTRRGLAESAHRGLDVEAYNERVSVMTNVAAALHLVAAGDDTQAIYRAHPAPEPARLDELEREIDATIALRALDPVVYRWRRAEEPLAAYLARLPAGRVADAIERQALLVNQRSAFTALPSGHHGLGAPSYARVTAPMREIVGVFTHKELWERGAGDLAGDLALRERVIAAGNAAKERQAAIDKDVLRLEIDAFLEAGGAPPMIGTVMGMKSDKLHVRLDAPPLELKVYRRDLTEQSWALGDRVELSILGKDERRDRWRLTIRR